MPPTPTDEPKWTDRVRDSLTRYSDDLFRLATGRLVKPKIGQSIDELIESVARTQSNAPVIDRRIRELDPGPQNLLRLIGLSRMPVWKVGHLLLLSSASGQADGFTTIEQLLLSGLVFPADSRETSITSFTAWFGAAGSLAAEVFVHPAVLARSRGIQVTGQTPKPRGAGSTADGLDWPLRIAAVWQRLRSAPVKVTLARTLFKRELAKLQDDPALHSPFVDLAEPVKDPGVLAFEWAIAAGLFRAVDSEYRAEPAIPDWSGTIWETLEQLFSQFFAVESWDPLKGHAPVENGLSPLPSAALLIFDHLASGSAKTVDELARSLWENHPSWQSALSREAARGQGAVWVEAFLNAIAIPMRIAERISAESKSYRLADFGRYLFGNQPCPDSPPAFPQTLTVQPNAEVIVYRQGLTPPLLADLSRFGSWKQIGPACLLELNADDTYRGLESGLTLAAIKQTLDRHAMRPLPNTVADLLRRWADKRERITVYQSATLVEFLHPAELDLALSRGLVSVKLTDRIGLTADGRDPDFKMLRLIGNREYDAKPVRCVSVAADGLTLSVDAGQADLLLDSEIGRVAEPVPMNGSGVRQFRLSPESLRAARARGLSLEALDDWFVTRTGGPLSAVGKLFLVNGVTSTIGLCHVVRLPSQEFADGLVQWPRTAGLIQERLGPTAIVVAADHIAELKELLAGLGIELKQPD